MLSIQLFTTTHNLVYVLIFLGYIGASVFLPNALQEVLRLRLQTLVFGRAVFLLCAVTYVGLAFDVSESWWVTISDHIQAVCIVGFIVCLLLDLRFNTARLRAAYTAIALKYEPEVALTVEKTIQSALRGKGH